MDLVGLLFAVLSAIFNGSFGTFSKLKPVQEAKVSGPHAMMIVMTPVIVCHS